MSAITSRPTETTEESRIDVTDLLADQVRAYAAFTSADLFLERRGARTFLVAGDERR